MPAPQEILNLVERFDQNRESYMSGDYIVYDAILGKIEE